MRRVVGFVLVGLGVALVTLAVSVRVWAYPQIARVSAEYPTAKDKRTQTDPPAGDVVSTGRATVFIAVAGAKVGPQEVDVESTRTTLGDQKSARGDHVYWETRVLTRVPAVTEEPISTTIEGLCFDASSGAQQTDCAKKGYVQTGPTAQSRRELDRTGLYLKFPFDTRKSSYDFWDTASSAVFQARYSGEDSIQGLKVYKFVQTIPDRKIAEQQLPGVLFGGVQSSPAVTAELRYANVRTLWVEPETGAIIRGQEQQTRKFVANGVELPALVGTLGYNDATVAQNVRVQKENAASLHLLRVTAPLWGAVLGVVLTVVGLVMVFLLGTGRRRASRSDHTSSTDMLTPAG